MKKLNLATLLLGAMLFLGLGATVASAESMKCGAGKCGSSMKAPVKKCSGEKEKSMRSNSDKCGAGKKGMNMDDKDRKNMMNDNDHKKAKCGSNN
jgi:hypothetical protein